jgi:phage shock protein PspC (stress-responsive transcriptional regulator)
MLVFKGSKLNLCVFFCNYTQKNKIHARTGVLKACYICKPDFWSLNQLFRELNMKMNEIMRDLPKKIQDFFEGYAFGVCTKLGEKLGMATSSIRLFFIYASFLTFGSPVLVYLALAFVMNIRKHLRKRSPIWDY